MSISTRLAPAARRTVNGRHASWRLLATTGLSLLTWLVLTASVVVGCASTHSDMVAPKEPPAAREEVIPRKPSPRHAWVPGHWTWRAEGDRFVWLPGRYERIPHDHLNHWVPGHWDDSTAKGYVWVPGRWR